MEKEEIFLPESEKRKPIDLFLYGLRQSRYSRDSLWRHSKLRIELFTINFDCYNRTVILCSSWLYKCSGRDSGAITFMLSRAPFGFKGNHIPALIGG